MKQDIKDTSQNSISRELHQAYEYFLEKKYKEAREILMNLSKSDDSGYCSLYLGSMYFSGYGVETDLNLAETYFRQSASKGIESAYFNLGSMAEQRGDFGNAVVWYLQLAKDGDPASLYKIYKLSTKHRDLNFDPVEADLYLRKSAELGYGYARREIQKLELSGRFGRIRQAKAILRYPFETINIIRSISTHLGDKNITFVAGQTKSP